jgi:glutamine amidotransferase
MLAILDYQAGNLTSVRRALDHLGIPCTVTADPNTLRAAQGVIFPGVGAAGSAMAHLTATGLGDLLKELVAAGKPLLGICLGCQIVLAASEENQATTLGIIPGRCQRFDASLTDEDGHPIAIPHMGWNTVRLTQPCRLFDGIDPASEFYFVHSYYPVPESRYVIGMTHYGLDFCSVHGKDGLWSVQFHPEKSGRPGLTLLSNFFAYCQEVSHAQ